MGGHDLLVEAGRSLLKLPHMASGFSHVDSWICTHPEDKQGYKQALGQAQE